ncbi:helix-turn-helix transcriptional regulator [Umezawaea endophytica]|uniref:Helix-turn-helix transcriptional regulator n=2 Tax=Umezawaea endophytica TaxID=1654476 RepID=A0A9X3AHU5_9PSEU|nr:helix-turn-helix transcriptional regulator [Umezawaea endophytica]MCS7481621.1 helix-turn-helix transcriptional regulator [Umezawaea endophytica]
MTRPPFRRRKLGRRLRQMREEAGMSIDEAALVLDKKRTSMYRIEAGESRVDVHLARSMMDVYDIYAPTLLEDVRYALQPGWWTTFGLQELGYVDVETEASVVREFALVRLPGLLQTEHYMRAVFDASSLNRTKSELLNQVKVRMIRQRRLVDEEKPLSLVALIDEIALRPNIGDAEVVRDQLGYLVMAAELPTVSLRVLPRSAGAHTGQAAGAFTIVEFSDPEDNPMLYVEYATGAIHIEEEAEVSRARLLHDHLLGRALSSEDSVALIERILAE